MLMSINNQMIDTLRDQTPRDLPVGTYQDGSNRGGFRADSGGRGTTPTTGPAPVGGAPPTPPPATVNMGGLDTVETMPQGQTAPRPVPQTPAPPTPVAPTYLMNAPTPAAVPRFTNTATGNGMTAAAGVTSNPIGLMDYKAGYADANTNAVTRDVQGNELVRNQLNDLVDSNGRYIQGARLRANEAASARGLLTSSMAGGAAERAAIDAALPIASQDAATFGNTAQANMDARNRDLLADQSNLSGLFGQSMGIRANLDESERSRAFTTGENAAQRGFEGEQAQFNRDFQGSQSQADREQRLLEAANARTFEGSQTQLNRDFSASQQLSDQAFQSAQADQRYQEGRIGSYFNFVAQREANLNNTLNAIYSNPNLSASEQAAAAANARAVMGSLSTSFNTVLADGIPPIFANPYPTAPVVP